MSRCLTLEEYLERFVDENTQSAERDITLVVTDQQAKALGFFFINGLAGFVECVSLERRTEASDDEGEVQVQVPDERDHDEFIN